MNRPTLLIASLLATVPFTLSAAGEVEVAQSKLPQALNAPIQGGFKVEKSFAAVSGLNGWVVRGPDGQYSVFFTTPDGQSLIAGALVSSSGENLTRKYTEQHVPKPDAAALWDKFEKSNYIATGALKDPKSVIYAIIDPNCGYCHYLYLALQPYETVGLQVRWVPVSIFGDASRPRAAAILAHGAQALADQQAKYGEDDAPQGVAVTPALNAKLEANEALMREAQLSGTPGIFYKDASGNVQVKNGMPMLKELAAIVNLPEQAQTDKRLERFMR